MVTKNGQIKITDFGLTKKLKETDDEFEEGDSKYIAKEVLESRMLYQLNTKSDVFSLGLTLLDLIYGVELPSNGKIYKAIRSGDLSEIFNDKKEYSTSKSIEYAVMKFLEPNIQMRPTCSELLTNIPELQIRAKALGEGNYQRTLNPENIRVEANLSSPHRSMQRMNSVSKFLL